MRDGENLTEVQTGVSEKKPYNLREKKIKNAAYREMIRAELADELYDKIMNIIVLQKKYKDPNYSAKDLAKELKIPIIALSQLSRAVDARPDHKPVLSDLRESGSIEQDADVVMFIYRDEYYNPETTTKPQTAEIIIAKQRSGETGSVDLRWIGKYTKFADPEKHYKG